MERRWKVLLVVSIGNVITFLDLFIVNVAFPDISRDFPQASLPSLSWILNAYTIILAALLVPAGRWADLLGRKRVFVSGLALFVAASLACAAAPSVEILVAARAGQAVGGAMMIPSSLGLILPEFPLAERLTAVGAWAAVGAVAAAAGPPIGGLLVQASWRWVFIVNLPIGIAAIVASVRVLRERRDPAAYRRPDVLGAALLAGGIGALALSIVQGPEWGWLSGRVIAGFLAAAAMVALVLVRAAEHPAPVIELAILRVRSFAVAGAALLVFFAGFSALLLSSVLFLIDVWRYQVLEAGLALAPAPSLAAVAALAAGRMEGHVEQRAIGASGALVFALGGAWWAWAATATPDYLGAVLPATVLTGIGAGLAVPAMMATATASLPPARIATGAAVMVMARQIGGALGVAVLIAILGAGSLASLDSFDRAWAFVAGTAIASSLICLALGPARTDVADAPLGAAADRALPESPHGNR